MSVEGEDGEVVAEVDAEAKGGEASEDSDVIVVEVVETEKALV